MAKVRSFVDELRARGVNPQVADLFVQSTGLQSIHVQQLTSQEYEQFVGARAPVAPKVAPPGAGSGAKAGPRTGGVAPHPGGEYPSPSPGSRGGTSGGATAPPATVTTPRGIGGPTGYGFPGGSNPAGGGGGATATFTPAVDWTTYLTDWGFTDEMKNQIQHIFATNSNPADAAAQALAYIRGTDWYSQHFPGIGAGIQAGLFGDESQYRAYVNGVNQFYQRYMGRAPTSDEISQYIGKGWDPTMVGEHLQGQAWLKTNNWNVNYQLGAFDSGKAPGSDSLQSLGDTVGGLNNAVGDALYSRLQAAQQKFTRIFEGVASTPSLTMLSNGQIAERGANNKPDVGA